MTPQEIITKLNDAKNGIYSKVELESIWIPNEMLPEVYHDNREGGKGLERLDAQATEAENKQADEKKKAKTDDREKSVIIHEGEIVSDNPSRLEVLNRYKGYTLDDSPIQYETNEDKLYRNQLTFAAAIGLDLNEEE
tara:strand:+ start:255 stop:665 length:411 start_codon:yes stop_codon:yes gene_type:complete